MAKPVSYFWAVPEPIAPLSDTAQEGLEYARRLAGDARQRVELLLNQEERYPPLTLDDVAEASSVSRARVSRCIDRARKELWGDLSDSGIYYRLRRRKQLAQRLTRICDEADCTEGLPADASAARVYCDTHRSSAARVARLRRNRENAVAND